MSQFIYNDHSLLEALKRIATAFEEQNRQNQAWIDLQVKWHEAGDPVGQRIVEIHEKDTERNEQWREEQRQREETHARRQDEVLRAAYEIYTQHLTEQHDALIRKLVHEEVQKALHDVSLSQSLARGER